MFLVQLNGVPTKMLGGSGASVNVIDEPKLETLVPKSDMQPPDMNLYAYGSKEKALPLLQMFVGRAYDRNGTIQSLNESVRGSREL